MRVAPFVFLVALAAAPAAGAAGERLLPLNTSAYSLCADDDACTRLGKVRLLGALVIPSRTVGGKRLASLSGLAWDEDDGTLYAVSDKGQLFGLKPEFRNGELRDVKLASSAGLIDPATRKPARYRRSDAEGLDILHGRNGRTGDAELVVSFEGQPRLARHRPDGRVIAEIPLSPPLNDLNQFRYNRMLEAVCVHPREGVLVAPEEPLNGDRNAPRLYRTDARSWRLPTSRGSIVAMECLPDGDVLMMEREFSPITLHIVVILRRLRLHPSVPFDQLLESEVVAVFDNHDGLNLDNFEGLTRHRGNRFFMVSDDNDTLLQRTLLVYFELLDEAATGK
jgi:hypothetical protein